MERALAKVRRGLTPTQVADPDARAAGLTVGEGRRVDPYGLLYRSGLWYLSGFCHLRQAVRDFRVDRIRGLRRTGEQFTRPSGFQPWDEAALDWIQGRLERGPLTHVRIAGEPWAIAGLAEHWYLGRCLIARAGREATFQIDPIGLEHAAHHLAGLGLAVRILEPDTLRQRLLHQLSAWVEHHNAKHP